MGDISSKENYFGFFLLCKAHKIAVMQTSLWIYKPAVSTTHFVDCQPFGGQQFYLALLLVNCPQTVNCASVFWYGVTSVVE